MFSKSRRYISSALTITKNGTFARCIHNKPNFTKVNYNVKRGNYNELREDHINFFKGLLGEQRIVRESSELEKYNVDWLIAVRVTGNNDSELFHSLMAEWATMNGQNQTLWHTETNIPGGNLGEDHHAALETFLELNSLHIFLEKEADSRWATYTLQQAVTNLTQAIWSVRETIPDGLKLCGAAFCYDVSLPTEDYFTLVDDLTKHMGSLAERVFGFGHLGDGNLHVQVEAKEFSKEIKDRIQPYIYNRTAELKGSISAEHGMGFLKAKYLDLARPPSTVGLMRDVKKLLDPNGILNPYKIFP